MAPPWLWSYWWWWWPAGGGSSIVEPSRDPKMTPPGAACGLSSFPRWLPSSRHHTITVICQWVKATLVLHYFGRWGLCVSLDIRSDVHRTVAINCEIIRLGRILDLGWLSIQGPQTKCLVSALTSNDILMSLSLSWNKAFISNARSLSRNNTFCYHCAAQGYIKVNKSNLVLIYFIIFAKTLIF